MRPTKLPKWAVPPIVGALGGGLSFALLTTHATEPHAVAISFAIAAMFSAILTFLPVGYIATRRGCGGSK